MFSTSPGSACRLLLHLRSWLHHDFGDGCGKNFGANADERSRALVSLTPEDDLLIGVHCVSSVFREAVCWQKIVVLLNIGMVPDIVLHGQARMLMLRLRMHFRIFEEAIFAVHTDDLVFLMRWVNMCTNIATFVSELASKKALLKKQREPMQVSGI